MGVVLDLLAGQTFRREIFRVTNHKSSGVFGLRVLQIVGKLLLHSFAAEYYLNVFSFDFFFVRLVNKLAIYVNRDCVASGRTTIFDWFHCCRGITKTVDHLLDIFICDRSSLSYCFKSFISSELNFGKDFDPDFYSDGFFSEFLKRLSVVQMNIRFADCGQRVFTDSVVYSFWEKFAQYLASNLTLESITHDGSRSVTPAEARHTRALCVLIANPVVGASYLRRVNFYFDLLTSWGDVCKFSFHIR